MSQSAIWGKKKDGQLQKKYFIGSKTLFRVGLSFNESKAGTTLAWQVVLFCDEFTKWYDKHQLEDNRFEYY
jgi:hypothetical protein